MNITPDSTATRRERALPDGQSIPKSTESVHTKERLQFYERQHEDLRKNCDHLQILLDKTKSDWTREVTDLLNNQTKRETDHELVRQENMALKEEIRRKDRIITQLNELSSVIQGEPNILETTDQMVNPFLQKLAPQLKSYRLQITTIVRKAKQQQQVISYLYNLLAASRAKGADYRRVPMSMESSNSSNMGLPLTGPTSNFNLTLSLASSDNRFGASRPYDPHPNNISEPVKLQQRPYKSDADISRHYASGSDDPHELRHRKDPVESSDHIYSNDIRPMTLDSNAALTDPSTLKKPVKTPKPVPRTRTSIKSLNSNSARMTLGPVDENSQSYTLGAINEYASSGLALDSGSSSLTINQPTRLTQNTVSAPHCTDRSAVVADTRNVNQVCDVCKRNFPNWSEREFMDHCIECAEDATAKEEGAAGTKASEPRTCPVCSLAFSQDVNQSDFENHVHGHFMENDTRPLGWETITK